MISRHSILTIARSEYVALYLYMDPLSCQPLANSFTHRFLHETSYAK
jgi:hypothetical protein